MNRLYPIKFEPVIKDLIWGGQKLRDQLNKDKATDKTGESWEISGHEGDVSIVKNGFLEGNSLEEIIEVYMGDLVGDKIFEHFGTKFPLLIKFIDASKDLSIQVHPNDAVALERHNSFGKTEMWYVMQVDEGSELISGFNQDVDKVTYMKHLKEQTLQEILNTIRVKPGDVFFMPAGRIHAIGKGIVLAEIQQTSDMTYRVYDYNRKDTDGNERELHTELAVDVIDYKYRKDYQTTYEPKINSPINLANCNYFTTNLMEIDAIIERDMNSFDSFVIYMCVEGEAEIHYYDKEHEPIKRGESILIPAMLSHYQIKPKDKAKLLEIYIAYNKEENENKNS